MLKVLGKKVVSGNLLNNFLVKKPLLNSSLVKKTLLNSSLLNRLPRNSRLLQPYHLRLQHVVADDGFLIPVNVIGEGEPVLLLHAFGMDARQFLPFILPLTKQFQFYLPHLRGWGLSADSPSTQFDFIEQYADDVEMLLEHICHTHQVESIDVAAISMGALVMWAYFNRHPHSPAASVDLNSARQSTINSALLNNSDRPNRVRRYLNIDQSPIVHNQRDWQGGVFGDKQAEVFEQFSDVLEATLPYTNKLDAQETAVTEFSHLPYPVKQQIVKMETAFSLMSVDRPSSRWLVNAMAYQAPHKLALYEHKTWRQKLHGLEAYLTLPYDYREALTTSTPTTLLIGGQSKLYDPAWQYKVADTLPNSTVIKIAHSGHAIPMDAPVQFTHALKQFLTQ